jgi:hypothetical protein
MRQDWLGNSFLNYGMLISVQNEIKVRRGVSF